MPLTAAVSHLGCLGQAEGVPSSSLLQRPHICSLKGKAPSLFSDAPVMKMTLTASGSTTGAEGISSLGSRSLRQLVTLHHSQGAQGTVPATAGWTYLIKPHETDTRGMFVSWVVPDLTKLRKLTATSSAFVSLMSKHITF